MGCSINWLVARVKKQRTFNENIIMFLAECNPQEPILVYLACCKKFNEPVVGSCVEWKPWLRNYKTYIKKYSTCGIVKHFIDKGNDPHVPFKYLAFLINDILNNVEHLSENETLPLQTQNLLTVNLVTQTGHQRIKRDMQYI